MHKFLAHNKNSLTAHTVQFNFKSTLASSSFTTFSQVNLGNPSELTIKEFAETVKRTLDSKSLIVHKPPVTDDPKKRKPDITKARQVLNWEPLVPLEKGLAKTIQYFKDELAQEEGNKRNVFLPEEL